VPTLAVKDTTSLNALYVVPNNTVGGQYNPMDTAGAVELVAHNDVNSNLASLAIVPHSSTACGVRMSGAGTAYCEIGAGGGAGDPSNRINFTANGTLEYGQSHQFVNGVAQYDAVGNAGLIIPCSTSVNATTPPAFEFHTFPLGGDAGAVSGIIALTNNTTATTNYIVMPSVYYGYTGSGGTYNAQQTSGALNPIVISSITNTQFSFNLEKSTGDNVNIILTFLVMYNIAGSDYPKSYS
jgi:hypothetical protein